MDDFNSPAISGDLITLLKQADREYDPEYQDLVEAATLLQTVHGDPSLVHAARLILEPVAIRRAVERNVFHAPSDEELYRGINQERSIFLCWVKENGLPVPYPVDLLNRHAWAIGSTGGGKTTAINHIISQLSRFCAIWIFDNFKDEFASIINRDPSFLLFDETNFAFNPYQAHPPIEPASALKLFLEVLCKETGLMDASKGELHTKSEKLIQENRVNEGSEKFSTLIELRNIFEKEPPKRYGRTPLYRDSILTRLRDFVYSAPNMYRYRKGFPIDELACRNFVFSVKNLGESHAAFVTMMLVLTLHNWRMVLGERNNYLRTLVVIDEAKHIAFKRNSQQQGAMPIETVMGETRAAGIGIFLSDQRAVLDDSVFGNAQLQIAFRVTSGDEAATIAKHMALSDDQRRALHTLQPGEAIIRIPTLDEPFIGVFPPPEGDGK